MHPLLALNSEVAILISTIILCMCRPGVGALKVRISLQMHVTFVIPDDNKVMLYPICEESVISNECVVTGYANNAIETIYLLSIILIIPPKHICYYLFM